MAPLFDPKDNHLCISHHVALLEHIPFCSHFVPHLLLRSPSPPSFYSFSRSFSLVPAPYVYLRQACQPVPRYLLSAPLPWLMRHLASIIFALANLLIVMALLLLTIFFSSIPVSYSFSFSHQASVIKRSIHLPTPEVAMTKELLALHKSHTWDFIPLPASKQVIGCKCVYKIKTQTNGSTNTSKTN